MLRDKMTVVGAHNSHLETTYKTLASPSQGDSDSKEAFYLVEDTDIARTVFSQFNNEMRSIQIPTTPISKKAKPGIGRSNKRHFYLLLGKSSSTEIKSVMYLNRAMHIRDALAHQTIYRYPMILVLRAGPSELDPKVYKLVEPYPNEVARLAENQTYPQESSDEERLVFPEARLVEEPKLTSNPKWEPYNLNFREVKKGQRLYKCLKTWIQSAKDSFSKPSDTAVISFR